MSGKLNSMVALVLALGTVSAGVAVAAGGGSSVKAGSGAGCQGGTVNGSPLPQGSEPVVLDPDDFVAKVDNPYFPLKQGSRWVYNETDTEGTAQKVVVKVTNRQKDIVGVSATVVRDTVTQGGKLVEDTWDWYAQDKCGNVWYLGEDTTEYENGKPVSKAGSWEHGVNGAYAGVVLPARPVDGLAYRQEYYAGEAEDAAEVLSVEEQAEVPAGHFNNVLLTKDFTPLHPKILEYKLYAKGVGPVLVFGVSGGSDREELVRFVKGGS